MKNKYRKILKFQESLARAECERAWSEHLSEFAKIFSEQNMTVYGRAWISGKKIFRFFFRGFLKVGSAG